MANIIDYVRYYRNKSFDELPFNEVDALILANISYLNFDKCIGNLPRTISEIAKDYFPKISQEKLKKEMKIYRDSHNLFNVMKVSNRYKDLIISDYQKVVAKEVQFGAITIRCKDFVYISFEGTNSVLSGWKEDCHLSHRYPIPSQILATEYINKNIKLSDKTIYIGGHSKGANLAVAGSMKAFPSIKRRITAIYDFDGPGMREKEFNTKEYKVIEPKIKKYVPNHSLIGMLMYYPNNFKTVNSTSKSILQHFPMSWNCFGPFFIEDSLSRRSARFSREIKKFVKEYSEEEMESFVETIFKALKQAGLEQTDTISTSKLVKCITQIKSLATDDKTKEKAIKLVNMLIDLHR